MKKYNRRILSVTLVAFLVSVMLPFFATYNISANAGDETSSIFGDKILICTASGFKWIDIDDLDSEPEDSHKNFECPLCFAAAQNNKDFTINPSSELAYYAALKKSIFNISKGEFHKNITLSRANQTRAPPPIFI